MYHKHFAGYAEGPLNLSSVCCRFCRSPPCCGQAKLQIFLVEESTQTGDNFVDSSILLQKCLDDVVIFFAWPPCHVTLRYIDFGVAETALIESVSSCSFFDQHINIKQGENQAKTLKDLTHADVFCWNHYN